VPKVEEACRRRREAGDESGWDGIAHGRECLPDPSVVADRMTTTHSAAESGRRPQLATRPPDPTVRPFRAIAGGPPSVNCGGSR
jgi:hypothetical protein